MSNTDNANSRESKSEKSVRLHSFPQTLCMFITYMGKSSCGFHSHTINNIKKEILKNQSDAVVDRECFAESISLQI